jgi:nucleoside-diphosphate-sugar epimerase
VPALQDRGWHVRCLVHRRAVPGADETVSGSVGDDAALARAADGASAIMHLAAVTHARRRSSYDRVNAAGTEALVAAAVAAGAGRFVLVSTRAINPDGGAYSASKLRAEAIVHSGPVEHVIVRLPEIYGGGGREGVDGIVAAARSGMPICVVGDGEQEICPLHVDDAVAALVEAADAQTAADRTYTLAGEPTTIVDFARVCVQFFGSRSRIVHLPEWMVASAAAAARVLPLPLVPDQLARLQAEKPAPTPEAASDLGFRARGVVAGLGSLFDGHATAAG